MTASSRLQDWAAPIAAISIVGVALSMSHPLFALLLERLGVSGLGIGLNSTAASLAMVPAAIVMPVLLGRFGLVPLMVVSTLVLVVAMLAVPVWQDQIWWAVIRVVIGFSATALFFASEFWIVANAPGERRGQIIGVYAIVLSGAFLLGPVILKSIGIDGWTPFLVAAGIIAAALPVLVLCRRLAPGATEEDETPGFASSLRFFVTDPGVLWGVVLFGAIEFGSISLAAVWCVRNGLTEAVALELMVALAAGAIAMQVPVGWLSDRVDRRWLLLVAGIATVAAPLWMIAFVPAYWPLAVAAFVWGGTAVALYTVALAELGARYRGAKLAAGNAAVVLAYGIGAFASPTAFGLAMDMIPPDGLMWLSAALGCLYVGLVAVRILARPRKTLDSGGDTDR